MKLFLHLCFSALLLWGIWAFAYSSGYVAASEMMPERFYWDEPAGAPEGSQGKADHGQKSLQEALEEDPCFKFTNRNLRRP